MAKVTGVGGVFLSSKNPARTKNWYETVLGITMDDYGHLFTKEEESEESLRTLQWSVFHEDSELPEPTTESFMVSYRVDDLEALLGKLKEHRVQFWVRLRRSVMNRPCPANRSGLNDSCWGTSRCQDTASDGNRTRVTSLRSDKQPCAHGATA